MTTPLVGFMQPMGERMFDNVGGQDVLIRRMRELGCEVYVCPWNKSNLAVDKLSAGYQQGRTIMTCGVSCGANVNGYVCQQLAMRGVHVAYAAWVQPSKWCISGWMKPIPPNVKEAFIVYGSCWRTLGFGCYRPPLEQQPALIPPDTSLYDGKKRVGNGGRTTVSWRFVDDLHPADFDRRGVQDPILRDMARTMNSTINVQTLMMRMR